MRKGKVMLLPIMLVAVLCVVGLIVGLVIMMGPTPTADTTNKTIFAVSDVSSLKEFGYKSELDGGYVLENVEEFGYQGTADITVRDEKVASISFSSNLSNEGEIVVSDAVEAVSEFVKAYSKELGLPIVEKPKLVQFADDETYADCPSDDYEALIKGYVLFEYSYKDTNGILWIVQIYSPRDNILSGTVIKYPDMSGYVDYEPQINLQKEVIE